MNALARVSLVAVLSLPAIAVPCLAETTLPAAPKFMQRTVGDWQVTLLLDGTLDVSFPTGKTEEAYNSVAFGKRLKVHGEEGYRTAFIVQDIGVMRPTYLIPMLYTSCFRPFCPQVFINGEWKFIGAANRGNIEIAEVDSDGALVYSFEFIFRAWPIEIDYDLFRFAGEATVHISQDGLVVRTTARIENISGAPVKVMPEPGQDFGQAKAGTLMRLLMLQSSYSCEPTSDNTYPDFVLESQKGFGRNGDYRFHTDDLITKERVLVPPYLSKSIFLGSSGGEVEYRLSNDTSEYETYGGELSPYANVIQGVYNAPDATSLRSHNDLMPICDWSVELVATGGSMGSGLKAGLQNSIATGHGPDADNVSAFYAPATEYFLSTGGTIPADFAQEFEFTLSNPPRGTLIRYPAVPKVTSVNQEKMVLETGIDVPEGTESLPVSIQIYLSDTPLVDEDMPPAALEVDVPISDSRQSVEIDISALTREYEGRIFGRVLAHFRRTYAVDLSTGLFDSTEFIIELPPGADINADGAVDAIDVQLVINAVLGIPVDYDCDVNTDRYINAIDVQTVINAALEL